MKHETLARLFRLIHLLMMRPNKSIAQLGNTLGVHARTIYRYIETLEDLGYPIDKDQHDRYFILMPYEKGEQLDHSEKELIFDLLYELSRTDPTADHILKKLNITFQKVPSPDQLENIRQYQNLYKLKTAIDLGKVAILKNYHSPSSETIEDRMVEPIEIDETATYLTSYDLNRKEQRQFHLGRVESVDLSNRDISHSIRIKRPDIFGFSGKDWKEVEIHFTELAYQFLIEEFPLSKNRISLQQGHYVFRDRVRDWRGIGRFILGVPAEVLRVEPKDLRKYLQKQMRAIPWMKEPA